MVIKVDRFEPKKSAKEMENETRITFKNKTGVLIKDHMTDSIIGYVQLENSYDKNLELTNRVIRTIEEWVVEQNGSED